MPDVRKRRTSSKPCADIQVTVSDDRWSGAISPQELSQKAVDAALAFVSDIVDRDCEVSILFCDDGEIRQMNRKWRSIDKPTNVLSFPANMFPGQPGPLLLGDIVVTLDTCQREAHAAGLSLEDHTIHLLVHGFLHLAGFDHEDDDDAEEMEALETEILASIGIADPYREAVAGTKDVPHV
jgi:probable rRNA maturation factor